MVLQLKTKNIQACPAVNGRKPANAISSPEIIMSLVVLKVIVYQEIDAIVNTVRRKKPKVLRTSLVSEQLEKKKRQCRSRRRGQHCRPKVQYIFQHGPVGRRRDNWALLFHN